MNAESLHLVCPHCDAVNRLPLQRLGEQPHCGQCKGLLLNGQPLAVDEQRFARHLSRNDLPVIVDFWAPWCAPCRSMAPAYEQAAQRLAGRVHLLKVDTEAHPALGQRYHIRSIPTLVAFRGGAEIARQSGAMPPAGLIQWIRLVAQI
jgi:thioredoxin 2